MEPVISVIVPAYIVELYLEKCVRSSRNQTLRDIEIILIDDGSPDSCRLPAARNTAIECVSEEWIIFVDGDDRLPEKGSYRKINLCCRVLRPFVPLLKRLRLLRR